MTAPQPTPHEAAGLVATAGRLEATVRGAAGWRYIAWLTGMTVATVQYGVALGVAAVDDPAGLSLSAAFLVCVAVLSLTLLPGALVNRPGFAARWVRAVVPWGLLFAAMMVIGLLVFRGEPAFWFPAALVTALPLALGARAEARA
jgi:hypothetical protein